MASVLECIIVIIIYIIIIINHHIQIFCRFPNFLPNQIEAFPSSNNPLRASNSNSTNTPRLISSLAMAGDMLAMMNHGGWVWMEGEGDSEQWIVSTLLAVSCCNFGASASQSFLTTVHMSCGNFSGMCLNTLATPEKQTLTNGEEIHESQLWSLYEAYCNTAEATAKTLVPNLVEAIIRAHAIDGQTSTGPASMSSRSSTFVPSGNQMWQWEKPCK